MIAFFNFVVYNGQVPRCSAVGSAPALGAGCREFESRHLDQKRTVIVIRLPFFSTKSVLADGINPTFVG